MSFLKTIILLVVVVLAVIVGAFLYLSQPAAPAQNYEEQVPQAFRSQNADLAGALYTGGIIDPFVDVNNERAYVAYELPAGYDPEATQRFVIGASADAAPNTAKLIALQYSAGNPALQWTVQMSDFKAFMNAQLTVEQLEEKIEKKTY